MFATFDDLLAPITVDEFRDMLRARQLATWRGGAGATYGEILSVETLLQAICSDGFAGKFVRVLKNNAILPQLLYTEKGRNSLSALTKLAQGGMGLNANGVDSGWPPLAVLKADIAAQIPENVRIAALLSTRHQSVAPIHVDYEDILVLQVEGAKRWNIHGDPHPFPVSYMSARGPVPSGPPVFSKTLERGDFLLVPAGFWHRCEPMSDTSLHISISFVPPSACSALQALALALTTEEMFCTPLSRFRDATERAQFESALKARLMEKIAGLSLTEREIAKMRAAVSPMPSEY